MPPISAMIQRLFLAHLPLSVKVRFPRQIRPSNPPATIMSIALISFGPGRGLGG